MSPTNNVYLGDIQKRAGFLTIWERQRNKREVHWLMECFAETLGVFLYVFPGVGSTLGFVLGGITGLAGVSSVFQIGFAYALGILFALGVCAGTSGGHFNPAVTLAFVLYRGFPVRKALRYVVAQILGGYIACMLVYYQWKPFILEMEAGLAATNKLEVLFTPQGPAGAFALYLPPGMTLGAAFLNEVVCCIFVALVIWAVSDPTNLVLPPALAAPAVSLSYAAAIWSFATPGVALNAARDVGGRLWVLTIWGMEAGGGRYAAIAALTNLPATAFAILLYEVFLTDSDRSVSPAALEFGKLSHGNRRLAHHDESTVHTSSNANALEMGRDDSKPSINAYEIQAGGRL